MEWLLIILLPYMVYFLLLSIRLQQKAKKVSGVQKKKSGQMFLSVVIPLKNEAANIQNLARDLAEQSLDHGLFEIIFVDDASSDSTLDILKSLTGKLSNLKILESDGAGKKKAIALGIEQAKGIFIVTTDGDCRVGEHWLQVIYNCAADCCADMIIGAVDIINTGSFLNRFMQLEFLALQAVTEVFARKGKPVICNGANLCFRNPGPEKYSEMVRVNITSGDDIFLMESYRRNGKKITWLNSPSGMVQTHAPGSFKQFLRQRIRWTSKSPFYKQPSLIALSFLVFLTNLAVVATFIMAFFVPGLWSIFLAMFIMKSIPDLFLLALMARKRGKGRLLHLFLPLQLIYPFYVVITGLAGIITGLFFSQQDK
ncbi:MAG: glycosyltransferase [Bacteroidales bacterium]|nr:glycosyltransferase [Bacteroidales bacterium]